MTFITGEVLLSVSLLLQSAAIGAIDFNGFDGNLNPLLFYRGGHIFE